MSYYVHNVPGRLRVRISSLRNRPLEIQQVRVLFSSINGIESIDVNEVTGSVVVNYAEDLILPHQILTMLRDNGYYDDSRASSINSELHGTASRIGGQVGKAIFSWAVGQILKANGLSFLAVLI
jgi:hypothetical protein